VLQTLDELDLSPPRLSKDRRRELAAAQATLAAAASGRRK
jgi:hypothetical protein